MADFGAHLSQQRIQTIGAPNSALTTIAAPTTNHTKGAWTEVSASTPFDAAGFWVVGLNYSSATQLHAIDIGVGAGGSEVVIVPNIPSIRFISAFNPIPQIFVPISIPAGSRVAARYQSSAVSGAALRLSLVLCGASFSPITASRAAALNFTTSAATTIPSVEGDATTADVKGAWVEMSSALPFDAKAVAITFMSGYGTMPSWVSYLCDLGIGAGGSETVIVGDLPAQASNTVTPAWHGMRYLLPVELPAGERLAMRLQASVTGANDRLLSPVIHVFG